MPILADWMARLGQDLFYPPNVGGWPGGRNRITTRSQIARANDATALVEGMPVGLPGLFDVASALVGLPLAISMVGLMEIVLGINFADLAQRFDRGGFILKCGISIVVLCFVGVYLAGCVLIYQRYFQ